MTSHGCRSDSRVACTAECACGHLRARGLSCHVDSSAFIHWPQIDLNSDRVANVNNSIASCILAIVLVDSLQLQT